MGKHSGNKHGAKKRSAKKHSAKQHNAEAREMPAAMLGDLGLGPEEGRPPKLERRFYEQEL